MTNLKPFLVYPTVNLTKGVTTMTGWIKYGLLPVLALGLVQCSDDKKPKGILDQKEMVSLMIDVYLAEAKISIAGISRDSAYRLLDPQEDSTLAKRGLNDSVLMANYNYYLQDPKELEKILDAVIDTLNLREQRMSNQPLNE